MQHLQGFAKMMGIVESTIIPTPPTEQSEASKPVRLISPKMASLRGAMQGLGLDIDDLEQTGFIRMLDRAEHLRVLKSNGLISVEEGEELELLKGKLKPWLENAELKNEAIEKYVTVIKRRRTGFRAFSTLLHHLTDYTGNYGSMLDYFDQMLPKLTKKFVPRRYQIPQGYANPRLIAIPAIWSMLEFTELDLEDLDATARRKSVLLQTDEWDCSSWLNVANGLHRAGTPTYFVDKLIGESLVDTDLPSDFTLQDVEWPHDAMLLMPREDLLETPLGNVRAIAISITREAIHEEITWDEPFCWSELCHHDADFKEPTINIIAVTERGYVCWTIPANSFSIDAPAMIADISEKRDQKGSGSAILGNYSFARVPGLPKFALNVILAMLAVPELKEAPTATPARPEKIKRGIKTQEALWGPTFFGRGYTEKTPGTGEGNSPRAHWRRGHWRSQRFGPGNVHLKIVWIKRLWVNPKT